MGIISKHCRKQVMEIFQKYPIWAFCFRWGILILMLAFSYSLIK